MSGKTARFVLEKGAEMAASAMSSNYYIREPFEWRGTSKPVSFGPDYCDVILRVDRQTARKLAASKALGLDLSQQIIKACVDLDAYDAWSKQVCSRCGGTGVEDLGSPACVACHGLGRKPGDGWEVVLEIFRLVKKKSPTSFKKLREALVAKLKTDLSEEAIRGAIKVAISEKAITALDNDRYKFLGYPEEFQTDMRPYMVTIKYLEREGSDR